MSLSSFLTGAWAMHRPHLRELESRVRSQLRESSQASEREAVTVSDFLPSADDLVHRNGVAVIPIHGLIVKRSQVHIGWSSTRVLIGTDTWRSLFQELIERDDVSAIVLDLDTGGGQVAGTELLAEVIFAARGIKPIVGVINEFCCSAGIWLSSACDRVVITRTGECGSIGVYTLHTDWTKWEKAVFGEELTTVIHAGRYKATHERSLTDELKEHEQGIIDRLYSEFVDSVAKYRGRSSEEVLENMADARCFIGQDAVDVGLCDAIGTLDDVLAELSGTQPTSIVVIDPDQDETDEDPDDMAQIKVTLDDKGQLINDKGDVVFSLADLTLSAAQCEQYFGKAVAEIRTNAVAEAKQQIADEAATAAIEAHNASLKALSEAFPSDAPHVISSLLAGLTVEQAKASAFDKVQGELAKKDLEIEAANKKTAEAAKAPGFHPSDAPAAPKASTGSQDDDSAKAAARQQYNASADLQKEYSSFEIYYAFQKNAGNVKGRV